MNIDFARRTNGLLLLAALAMVMLWARPAAAQDDDAKRVGVPGGMYDKPYIVRMGQGTVIGGYMDMEFEAGFDEDFNAGAVTFDQHRLIPFIFSEVTDRIHFATELEFEHGGNVEEGGEIKVEYAAVDFTAREWLTFRAGIVLSPLGYFNLVHDSPWNDLTERPIVDQQIIPTTLSEAGMGFTGTFYPTPLQVVSYEVYVVNGFDGDVVRLDGGQPGAVRLRSGRGSQKADNNRNKALAGRLSWSPRLGVQLGGYFHTGAYDAAGSDNLTILAADAEYVRGALQLLGEYAHSRVGLGQYGLDAQTQHGFYLQGNYHLPADRLLPGSVFTAVARYDYVDYALGGPLADERVDRFTVGLNYRPVEDTVFKLDWGFDWTTPPGGARTADGSKLFFSVATYF